jgi:hypothetical protein
LTHQLTAYPDALRPHVAQILRYHYETDGGHVGFGGSRLSVTGAVIERAKLMSMSMRKCTVCKGQRTERIPVSKGLPIEVDCWNCGGEGELGQIRKTQLQDQTKRCNKCMGVGTVPRPEYRELKRVDPNPLKCEACDGRSYHYAIDVICGTGEYEQAQPVPGEARSEASDALALMRTLGQGRSRAVLEIAYGEVGRRVERQLDMPVAMSVWPHTAHGKRLLRALGHYRGEPPYERMCEALSGDFQVATLASLANTAAIAMLELALSHLFAADERTGGTIRKSARKLKLATYWSKEKK